MAENEKIKRSPGQHCKRNEVKTEILMHILKANGAVSGSEIRRHLNEKYGIGNNKNIKNHLEKLRKDHCIEKFKLVGDDFGNKWDITKLDNLKNIDQLFPKLQQNEYDKCLSLVPFEKIAKCLGCVDPKILRTSAQMSRSFYDVCLKGDFEIAYSQINTYFFFTEKGHESKQYLNKLIDNFYNKYIEKINVSLETKTSKDTFIKVLENHVCTWVAEEPELEMNNQLNDNLCILHSPQKMLVQSTSKMLEENSTIKKDISVEVQNEISDETSETLFKALLKNPSKGMYNDLQEIKTRQKINSTSAYYVFFNCCVLQDFQNNTESSLEKRFLQHLDNSLATLSTIIRKKDPMDLFTEWLSFRKEQDNIYSSFSKSDFDQED